MTTQDEGALEQHLTPQQARLVQLRERNRDMGNHATRITQVCPDCMQGYHEACGGLAYDPYIDKVVSCGCDDRRCAGERQ